MSSKVRKRSKRSKVLIFVLLGLMALLAAMTAIVVTSTTGKGMLPQKYTIIILGVVGAILVISIISFKRKWSNIVMIVITALACAVMVYAALFTNKFNQTIAKITGTSTNLTHIKVAVLDESPYQTISDLTGKTVAYSAAEDSDILDQSMDNINEHVDNVDYVKAQGVMALADDLRNGEAEAIIVNESYIAMLDDIEGYEGFEKEIRYIYEFDVTKEMEDTEKKELGNVFTLYISGIDTYGSPAVTSRSDVNILAVVNTKTKHMQLINTPRDAYVYLPNSGNMKDKLTHAGIYGIENSMTTIGNLYDIKVDSYMRVNFTGFQDIIDSIGGIDVYSDYAFTVTGGGFYYDEGMNHLNGIEALAFARERKAFTEGDNQRGKDQMKVIEATVKKITSSSEILTNYNSIFNGLADSMQTSIASDTIYKLVNQQLSDSSDWKIDSYAVTGSGTYAETFSMPGTKLYVMIPDDDSIEEAKRLIRAVQNEK